MHGDAKEKKPSTFEARKVYSRLVKEINDDQDFQKEQNEFLKTVLPQIEKRGENLIKEKKQKVNLCDLKRIHCCCYLNSLRFFWF